MAMPKVTLYRVNAVAPIASTMSGSKQTKQESQSQHTPNKKQNGGNLTDGKSFGDCLQQAMSNMKRPL